MDVTCTLGCALPALAGDMGTSGITTPDVAESEVLRVGREEAAAASASAFFFFSPSIFLPLLVNTVLTAASHFLRVSGESASRCRPRSFDDTLKQLAAGAALAVSDLS